MSTAAPTRTEQVYARMRSDILAGHLTPGAKLPFAELVARYGGSTSVIREGLTRLVEQGLVQAEPQHGFRVVPLSISDLDDLTTARCELEGLVLRLSIAAGDLEWESAIVAAQHTLERTPMVPQSNDTFDDSGVLSDEWRAAHARFHNALIAGCPNVRLRTMASSLRDAAELYRSWSGPLGHDQHRDIPSEHEAIAEAALSRDADRAVAELTKHLRRTAELLIGLETTGAGGDGADAREQAATRED
jgi:DNA-binding GntR family transcriptional regulator